MNDSDPFSPSSTVETTKESNEKFHAKIAKATPLPLSFLGVCALSRKPIYWPLLFWVSLSCLMIAGLFSIVHRHWIPVLESSVQSFPEKLQVREGRLVPIETDTVYLQQNRFLSLEYATKSETTQHTSSDIRLRLEAEGIRLDSFFGSTTIPWAEDANFPVNAEFLMPWWNARKIWLAGMNFVIFSLGLFLFWLIFSLIGGLAVQAMTTILRRPSSFRTTWGIASGSLMPGATILFITLVAYALGLFGLVVFALMLPLQLLPSGVLAIGAAFRLPKQQLTKKRKTSSKADPFAS